MYRSVVLAAFLLCSCGRHEDPKPTQVNLPPTVLTTNVVTASNEVRLRDAEALSEEGRIRVLASEYMLRSKFAHLTNGIIFVSLTNTEMQALAAKLPGCRFRPIDKMIAGNEDDGNLTRDSETRDIGFGLIVNGELTGTNEAIVLVGGQFTGSATIYQCHMYKRPSEWTVSYISGPGIADGGWERPPRK